MAPREPDPADPGAWVQRLEDQCRREAMEIRLRAGAQAEASAAEALDAASSVVARRIERLRELRGALAEASARIERDLMRAAAEIRRRAEESEGDAEAATAAGTVTYPQKLERA